MDIISLDIAQLVNSFTFVFNSTKIDVMRTCVVGATLMDFKSKLFIMVPFFLKVEDIDPRELF
jgi:hypothetical protein